VIEKMVDAGDVTKLKRDVVERVTDDHGNVLGVKMKDESLRAALGLEPGDVITAIGGRAIKREFDVYDAVLGMSMMDASIVYVDVLREKKPTLVRWRLDGDLRSARRDPIARPRPLPGGVSPNPFLNPTTANDPLVDTVRKLDDLNYEVPRTTIDLILANPDFYARQARLVPSVHGSVDGFKLYAIQPGSLWAAIGVMNGDTLHAINGTELTSPDKALELFQKIRDANEIKLDVIRRGGSTETITVAVK
jgi:type II secretory pathway component PulC